MDTKLPASSTTSSLLRSSCIVACSLLLVAGALTGAVAAHTELASTSPDDGEQLDEPPQAVVLEFSGERIQAAEIQISGPDGEDVAGEASIGDGSDVVTAPLDPSGDGVYTVTWEILAEDGHSTNGAFFFVVGDEALDREQVLAAHGDGDDDTGGGPPFGESAIKGLLLVGVLVLLGAPVTIAAIAPAVSRSGSDSRTGARRGRAIVSLAATALLVAVTVLGLLRVAAITGSPLRSLRTFAGTSVGRTWLLQVLVAGVTLGGVLWGQRQDNYGLALAAGFLGGFAVAFTVGWTSHSAALINRLLGVTVGVAHLAGAALWVGGLVVVGVVVPPYLRETESEAVRDLTASIAQTYSILALAGVVVASSTGLVLLSWHVPSVSRLLGTAYGQLLTAKLALVAVALGLGGINRFLLLRALRDDPERASLPGLESVSRTLADGGRRRVDRPVKLFVRTVRVEGAILLAVVVLSGVLTSAPTAAAVAVDGDSVQSTQVGDVEVVFEPVPSTSTAKGPVIDAGEPVVYDVRFTVAGTPPDTVEEVELTLQDGSGDGSMELDPELVAEGTYSVRHTLPSNGTWTLQVDAFVDEVYISERFAFEVVDPSATATDGSADENSGAYGDDGGLLADIARLGALGVGLVGTLAVAVEARAVRSRGERSSREP